MKSNNCLLSRLAFTHCVTKAKELDVLVLSEIPKLKKLKQNEIADILEIVVVKDIINQIKCGLKYFRLFTNSVDSNENEVARKFTYYRDLLFENN